MSTQPLTTKCVILVALLFIMSSALSLAKADSSLAGKKLIEFGGDRPSAAYVRQHIDEMQKVPFDGVTIVTGKGWNVWSRTKLNPNDLQPTIDNLEGVKFGRLTDNFIHMVSYFPKSEEEIDFFDPEWSTIIYNATCFAKVAKATGCKGILFDTEDYSQLGIWNYTTARSKSGHSYEEYVAKARERGREFISSISKEYPDITFLVLHGYETTIDDTESKYPTSALLCAFMDGMCEAAEPGMTLVDGFEDSYGYISPKLFKNGRDKILKLGKAKSLNPKAYEQHVRMGFGLWPDYMAKFDVNDFSKNAHSPESFRAALANAMTYSDKYVWVYSDPLRWWDRVANIPANAPAPYIEALSLAKQGPGRGKFPAMLKVEVPGGVKAADISRHDDASTFADMKKSMTEVFDFPKDSWKLKYDESNTGEQSGWYRITFDDSQWQPVSIGKFWDEIYGEHTGYGWYRLKFTAPAKSDGKSVFLAFGAADESAWVWLNGWTVGSQDIGTHAWIDPFALDVTPYIRPGQENVLAIKVLNSSGPGGLWKSIKLMEK